MKTTSLISRRLSSRKTLGKLNKLQNFQFMSMHCFLLYTLIPFERSFSQICYLLLWCSLFEPWIESVNEITQVFVYMVIEWIWSLILFWTCFRLKTMFYVHVSRVSFNAHVVGFFVHNVIHMTEGCFHVWPYKDR